MVNLEYLRRIYLSIEDGLCRDATDGRISASGETSRISQHTKRVRNGWLFVGCLSAALLLGGYLECVFTVGPSATFCQYNPTSLQLIECLLLLLNLVSVHVLVQLGEKQLKVEAKDRVLSILDQVYHVLREDGLHANIFHSVNLTTWEQLRVADSQIPSVTYCYCSSDGGTGNFQWNLRPDCFLSAGDIIALQAGMVAPATIQLLPRKPSVPADTTPMQPQSSGETVTFDRGEKIRFTNDGSELQDLSLFKVLRPPLVDLLREYLAVHSAREERADTMIPELWQNVNSFSMLIVTTLCIISFLANVVRLGVRPDGFSAFHLLFFRSLTVVVCMLPNLALPVLEQALELYGTAELLACYHHSDETKAMPSFGKIYKYVRKLMWAWRPRNSAVISASAFRSLCREDRTLFGDQLEDYYGRALDVASLLDVPLKRSRILLRLGSITMLSCLDEGAVLSPLPRLKEVFLPKGDQGGVTLKVPYGRDTSTSWFHSSSWNAQLPALKSVGLSCMVGTSLHIQAKRATEKAVQNFNLKQCLATLPAACSRITVPDHLRELSQSVGVSSRNLRTLAPCMLVAISDKSLPCRPHPVLTWSYHRNTPRVYALVVEDLGRNLRKKRRADAGEANKREVKRKLHVLSWGHPKALLKWCAEYWDGESIWPLLPDDQSHILSVESDWDMKDSDIIAFAYTPIPTSAAYLFPKATTSGPLPPAVSIRLKHYDGGPKTDGTDAKKSPEQPGDPPPSRADPERTRNQVLRYLVLNAQIFTGMICSQEKPRRSLTRLISKLDGAGIRFVHFSPRPPKRARAIAEKLGLETDWNTAISLLPLKKSPLESLEQRSEWDVKAKLPHGVGEIRQHLEDIDDVPLRVPMFTDCDPASSFEMLGILQEHGEIAGALGSAYSSHNFSMFLRAHASIAIQTPLLLPCCNRTNQTGFCSKASSASTMSNGLPRRITSHSAASQLLELAGSINSLGCGLVLGRAVPEYPVVYNLLRQARSLLLNYKQSLLFAISIHLLLALFTTFSYCASLPDIILPIHVIWISWIPGPLLTLPLIRTRAQRNIMKLMPSKDDKDKDVQKRKIARESSMRLLIHHLLRCLLSACLLVILSVYTLALYADVPASDFIWGNSTQPISPDTVAASQALILLFIIWLSISDGMTYMYRNLSLVKELPRNWTYPFFAVLTLLLQIVYGELICQSTDEFNNFRWLSRTDAVVWICGAVVFPFISICVSEITKRHERKWYYKNMRRLRLLFETRLGMYSPR